MKTAVWLRQDWQTLGIIVALMTVGLGSPCAVGDEPGSGRSGRGVSSTAASPRVADLFEDDVLADNVFAVRKAAGRMSAEARYEFLLDWVLPSKSHSDFRLAGKQTQTDPVVPLIDDHPFDIERQRLGVERGERRIHTGGNLVSPALDLIESARELGKLDELRFAVQVSSVSGEVQERCRLSMLAMIAIVKCDEEAARLAVAQLYNRFLVKRFPAILDRMPETLLVSMAVDKGMLLDESSQFLVSMLDAQIRQQNCNGPFEWDRLITSLMGRIQHHGLPSAEQSQPWNSPPDLKSWHWTSRIHSWGHGSGIPSGHLHLSDGAVKTLAYMDDEFLFFASPLRGNYSLECDCTGFGWKEFYPFVAGSWITPAHDHKSVQVGQLCRVDRSEPVDPKLSRVDDWIHFRVDVRDGMCSRYINSRLVCEELLPVDHDPWVAFRNPGGGNGNLRNVRITGDPVIPDEVTLSELRAAAWTKEAVVDRTSHPVTHLHGWMPWNEDPWYPEKLSWKLEEASSGATQIVGQRKPELAGTFAERLLRYHWPIVWNSQISYEFFYRDGEVIVHPAVGRRALLLHKAGVQNHWVTNSVSDLTTLDPLNSSQAENRISVAPLPFKQDAWNQLSLSIAEDTLAVSLNGVPVFEGDLEPTNDRTFGLFYYCDQSEARFRNVVLKGDWPKTLPPAAEQELRGTETDALDHEREALAESFEFDFTTATEQEFLSKFRIAPNRGNPVIPSVHLQSDGLHMDIESAPRNSALAWVSPLQTISGDFDVIAKFDALKLKVADNGSSAIYLGPTIREQTERSFFLYRGTVQHRDTPLTQRLQVELIDNGPTGFKYSYPAIKVNECTSGRLRVARRGKRFSYLIAPLDSDQFRLLYSAEATEAPLLPGTFLLRSSCYSQGIEDAAVSVIWKSVSVKAESLKDNPTLDLTPQRNLYVITVPDVDALRKPDVPLLQTYCENRAKQFVILAKDVEGRVLQRLDEPVLVYQQGEFSCRLVHVWTLPNGRPAAIGAVQLQKNGETETYREIDEFHSLHSSPLKMLESGREKWNVVTPGLNWQEIAEAPAPATTAEEMWAQAAKLTQRFSSAFGGPDQPGAPMTKSPLYPYQFEENGRRLAGALYAFAIDNDPEVLLSLEVRPDKDGQPRWHFAGASYTNQDTFVLLDAKQIWSEAPAKFAPDYRHFGFYHRREMRLDDGLTEVTWGDVRQIGQPGDPASQLKSPEWSADGSVVAYEVSTREAQNSQLRIVKSDGTATRTIGPGSMPSLSPDGKQAVFSLPGFGILTTSVDQWSGAPMSATGFAAQWSPDGQHIAWIFENRIVVFDMKTRNSRPLLNEKQASEFLMVDVGLGWSHDSKSIAFKAIPKTQREEVVAVVDLNSPDKFQVVYSGRQINPDLSWHPDGRRILFSAWDAVTSTTRLYAVHRDAPNDPQLLPGQPPGWNIFDCDWSPDGRNIVFTAVPVSVE